MIIIGVGVGFLVGLVILIPYLLVTSSKWWHLRCHAESPNIVGCDHCYREWRSAR